MPTPGPDSTLHFERDLCFGPSVIEAPPALRMEAVLRDRIGNALFLAERSEDEVLGRSAGEVPSAGHSSQ